eukprot:CCRYP_019141-RA/>CCRYP_019141-RA protein AED:0.29 eAED:0.29 QI:257/1/1/1/0.5/0.33/3/1494/289
MTPTDETNRLENTTTCLPLAYGSIAFNLGPQADEYHTHKWTLYLRSPDKSFDLSVAISKVVFQLHPSFAQATREVTEPPFEVTESGWGEFEASLRIIWREVAEERSTVLTHVIKLYPTRPTVPTADPLPHNINTTEPVVSEKYDEVVFTNPKMEFHKLLQSGNKRPLSYPLSNQPAVIEYFRMYDDGADVQNMLAAKKFLEGELRNVKDRLLKADHELDELKTSLTLLKGNPAAAAGGGGGDPSGKSIVGGVATSGKVSGGDSGAKLKNKPKSKPALMEQNTAKRAKTS